MSGRYALSTMNSGLLLEIETAEDPGPAQGIDELGTCLERHFSSSGIFRIDSYIIFSSIGAL
jgi:hypothetical protein